MNPPVLKVMIHVLDDQEMVLRLIERAFLNEGIKEYQLFSSEAEFIDAANDDVHIAVIDYMLTGEHTGLDVCKLLLDKNPRCHVIIMSGNADADVIIDFMNSGAWKYVKKWERNYTGLVVEYVKEATKNIQKDLEFYTTLINKYNESEGNRNDNPIGNK